MLQAKQTVSQSILIDWPFLERLTTLLHEFSGGAVVLSLEARNNHIYSSDNISDLSRDLNLSIQPVDQIYLSTSEKNRSCTVFISTKNKAEFKIEGENEQVINLERNIRNLFKENTLFLGMSFIYKYRVILGIIIAVIFCIITTKITDKIVLYYNFKKIPENINIAFGVFIGVLVPYLYDILFPRVRIGLGALSFRREERRKYFMYIICTIVLGVVCNAIYDLVKHVLDSGGG